MEYLVSNEIHMFQSLHGGLQFVYLFYLISGVVLPFGYLRQVRKYRDGVLGVGDTCIRSLVWMAFCRIAPLVYSFTVIWSFPLFFSVLLDMVGRVWVIFEAHAAGRRALVRFASGPVAEPAPA